MSSVPTILWFRRDLRLADHPALVAAIEHARATGSPLLPIFVWEPGLVHGARSSANRTWFLRESIAELSAALTERGSGLIELEGPATSALPTLVAQLRGAGNATAPISLFITRDHTPYARSRDRAIAEKLAPLGVALHAKRGLSVVEPDELLTGGGTPYGVYTPYFRRWLERIAADLHAPLQAPTQLPPLPAGLHHSPLARAASGADTPPTAARALLQVPGERAARAAADAWIEAAARRAGVASYAEQRDLLADETGTSRLSAALHFGLISPSELVHRLRDVASAQPWVRQLAWRDFYIQVLWHAPHAARASWRPAYDAIPWEQHDEPFNAWCEGRTGYPVVDAAMRQLLATGFMHNRARMIAASFLTKDLLVDWRRGEGHFLNHLIDGDIAANNGGWQWSAGSGTDAQPYFRIFNPVAQGERFDPDGAYVRRWVPELAALSAPAIHAPWKHPEACAGAGITLGVQYPEPIVDHAVARARTLAAFAHALKK